MATIIEALFGANTTTSDVLRNADQADRTPQDLVRSACVEAHKSCDVPDVQAAYTEACAGLGIAQ